MSDSGNGPTVAGKPDRRTEAQRQDASITAGALQSAIFNSANFSSIATDARGVIQIFNVGAERMLGYSAAEVVDRITPADISDSREVIERAKSLTAELGTPIQPGFEALVFKASRGIEDIYELTYIRKDGSRFPAVVSVTALRDAQSTIIGYLLIGTDNTARKQVDDRLRTASQYARSLIEASLDPLVTISPEGKITDVNAGSVKVTGVPREKLIGTDFSDYFTEPDKAREGYQQVFAKGFVTDYPLTIRHEDGRLTDVLYNASVYRDVQGNVLGVFAAARDITERKQAEEALLKAGALQSAIFNSANFSSIATDAKGVIQIFNVGAERMLGYSAAEVMNKITPADISDSREVIERAKSLTAELGTPIQPGFEALVFKASRGIEDIYELTYIRKDGSRFPAVVSVTALRDAQSTIIGYLLIGTDNTARKQIEAERQQLLLIQEETNRQLQKANVTLRDSEEKLSVTLNSIGDAVIATDALACVTLMNPLAEYLTGWTQAQARGRQIGEVFNIINQATREPAAVPVMETLAHGTVQGLANHTIVIARGGTECAIADSCAPIRNRDGEVVGAVLVFRDVTEEYAVQQALHDKNVELEGARDVAEKANLAKSDFLSSMSHELRTPLNAILGFTQLMESASPPPTPPQKRNIDQILKAGWYLLELINEILDLALIESGTATLSHEPVSLVEVMLECRTMIEPQAQQRGISMTFPRFEGPCFVSADRTRVKQVLINLLFNAIKYNRPEGSVAVEYSSTSPQAIRISVRDTGEGLDATQMGQLFQPFNRLGRETSVEEGTGIGLMVTKRLVELMGGTIGAESTVGVGSVFWFELSLTSAPLLAPGHAPPETPLRLQVPAGTPLRTVLYVEDNPANLELVEQLIARRPELRLLSAADGTLGVEFARVYQPDVILMDINLPGISGLEAMRRLRADLVTAHIPVIALSANAVPRDIEKALEAGFLSYLTKPIKVNQFMEALDAALTKAQTGPGRAAEKESA